MNYELRIHFYQLVILKLKIRNYTNRLLQKTLKLCQDQ